MGGRFLPIGINQHRAFALQRIVRGQIGGQRGFTGATLGTCYENHVHTPSCACLTVNVLARHGKVNPFGRTQGSPLQGLFGFQDMCQQYVVHSGLPTAAGLFEKMQHLWAITNGDGRFGWLLLRPALAGQAHGRTLPKSGNRLFIMGVIRAIRLTHAVGACHLHWFNGSRWL